jgi:hypothetical protein
MFIGSSGPMLLNVTKVSAKSTPRSRQTVPWKSVCSEPLRTERTLLFEFSLTAR